MAALIHSGEHFPSKVSGKFANRNAAQAAADRVSRQAGVDPAQIRVVEPDDPALARKLEPESGGIARLLVWSHVALGIAGAVLGILIALVMMAAGVTVLTSSPGYALFAVAFFGAIAGLLLAGFVTLRPDHDRMIAEVRKSSAEGHWHVVVHTRDRNQERLTRNVLRALSKRVTGTL